MENNKYDILTSKSTQLHYNQLTSPHILREWFVRYEVGGHTAGVLLDATESLCCSHLAFFQTRRCIHTMVLSRQQFGRIPVLFYSKKFNLQIVNKSSMAVHNFSVCMVTSLSVDGTLLPRYMKLSINFRGVSLNV